MNETTSPIEDSQQAGCLPRFVRLFTKRPAAGSSSNVKSRLVSLAPSPIASVRIPSSNRQAAMSRIEEIIRGGNQTEIDQLRHDLSMTPSTHMLRLCESEGIPVKAVWNPTQLLSLRWRCVLSLAQWLGRMATGLKSQISCRNPRYLKALEIRRITSQVNLEAGILAQATPKRSASCAGLESSCNYQGMQPTKTNDQAQATAGENRNQHPK